MGLFGGGAARGYNVNEINELMNTMNDAFLKVGEAMAEGWPEVVNVMQTQWVGIDEQNFEDKLAKRFVELYNNCQVVVETSFKNIVAFAQAWEDMQNNNRLEGGDNMVMTWSIQAPAVNLYDIASIVKKNERAFTANMNMGLLDAQSSATTILTRINMYTDSVKNRIQALFGRVDTSGAFLDSTQSQAIQDYISQVGETLKALNTDVDDMTQNLAVLAGSSYENLVQEVANAANTAKNNMSSSQMNG